MWIWWLVGGFVVFAVVVGVGFGMSHADEEESAARSFFDAMSDDEILDLEWQSLRHLWRYEKSSFHGMAATFELPWRVVRIGISRLHAQGDVKSVRNSGDYRLSPTDLSTLGEFCEVRLTGQGYARYREESREVTVVHGDYIHTESGYVVNRSYVADSFNAVAERYDDVVVEAISHLEKVVRDSHNSEAMEQVDEFIVQAAGEPPNRIVMRSLLSSIEQAVPAVATLTDVVSKLQKAFG